MKRLIFYSYVLALTSLLTSCNDSVQISWDKLDVVSNISQLNDSTFLSGIRTAYYDREHYYLSDYERDKIIVLDQKLKFIKSLGEKGQGPGELLGASHIYVNEDSIYIYNDAKKAVELFSNNHHIRTINLPHDLNYESDIRFCLKNNLIYISNPNEFTSISCLSFDGNIVKNFGEIEKYPTNKETIVKNKRHLCNINDNVLAVSDCYPKIEMYNLMGEKINEYDFSDLHTIRSLMRFINKQGLNINSYYQIIPDIYVFKNKLLLLILSIDENKKLVKNKILQFEIGEQTITPTKLLDLGTGWFGPICASQGFIIAYNNTTNQLVEYAMND